MMEQHSDAEPSKKRRKSVVLTACVECRRRKAKCDGRSPCDRCTLLNLERCEYEISIRESKAAMMERIEELQTYRRQSELVLNSLASSDNADSILAQLERGDTVDAIAATLATGPSSISSNQEDPQASNRRGFLNSLQSGDNLTRSESDHDQSYLDGVSAPSWTIITSNSQLIETLMSLYFCWEYPVFAPLSKRHFYEDFQALRPRYCSSLLVNAMLALGSRYASHQEIDSGTTDTRGHNLGDRFFAEAERLLAELQDNSLSDLQTIQALGLMSLHEASCGRDSTSRSYSKQSIRMAVEMGLQVELEDNNLSEIEHEIRRITFWGAFLLDQAWSMSMGRVSHLSYNGVRVQKPAILELEEQIEWKPYVNGVGRGPGQPSNLRSVFNGFCELSQIMHRSVHTLYDPVKPVHSRDILEIYTQYLYWYNSLPKTLRSGTNFTPAVIFIHLFYHWTILLLFRPFIKLRLINSVISPREVCNQAAEAITSLMRSYRHLYTLHQTPCFTPYIIVASSITHLMNIENPFPGMSGFSEVLQGTDQLLEMSRCHPFAETGIHILRTLAQQWGIVVPMAGDEVDSETKGKNTSNSEAYPMVELKFFGLSISTKDEIHVFEGSQNLLFSPFPALGLPLLADGRYLQIHGFEPLILNGEKE